MNKGFLTVGIIILASLTLLLVNVITNMSTGGEVDFYLVKETSEAAMNDALDDYFFSQHGVPRIDKEKYMESFLRRFADNVNDTRDYVIGFYALNEVPPKVSVKVDSLTTLSFQGEAAVISTSINQLVEMTKEEDDGIKYELNNKNSDEGKPSKIICHSDAIDEIVVDTKEDK